MTVAQRPRYQRADPPPPMRFQPRDGRILQTIHDFDGVVARRHLKTLFWPNATWRAMEKRLSLLYHNGYLDWPTREQWGTRPIPEPVCWLGWKGILWLAVERGLSISPPTGDNENQMRKLERNLRQAGLRWLRQPRWSQLGHDLAIVDFRVRLLESLAELPHLSLDEWVNESAFAADSDEVTIELPGRNGQTVRRKRRILPDAYFVIRDQRREAQGLPSRARFLLELDNGTHDLGSFAREKVAAGMAYLQSSAYKERFGENSGRWLVVTRGGERRLQNLMQQARHLNSSESGVFLFSTFKEGMQDNVLHARIWHLPDESSQALVL